jgi:hypothetical protein
MITVARTSQNFTTRPVVVQREGNSTSKLGNKVGNKVAGVCGILAF